MASHPGILCAALTWNLFHGRDRPPDDSLHSWRSRLLGVAERGTTHAQVNHSLRGEFAATLAGFEWHVALLQEAPPRWLGALAGAARADGALALTARNTLAPLRALVAERNPDLIASGEGGSNVVLVRAPGRIAAVERVELARRPERRRLLLCRVEFAGGGELAVACMHLSETKTERGPSEVLAAAERAVVFAGDAPLLFGGDLNLRPQTDRGTFDTLAERYALRGETAPRSLDHLLSRGLDVARPAAALAAARREVPGPGGLPVRLSDHAPVVATFGVR